MFIKVHTVIIIDTYMHVYVYTYAHVQVSSSQGPLMGTSAFHTTHFTVTDLFSLQKNRFGSANQVALTKVEEFSCLKIQLLSTPFKPSSTALRNTDSVRRCYTRFPRQESCKGRDWSLGINVWVVCFIKHAGLREL